MSKRNTMPGLRLKGGIWHIEKRCKFAKGGWLRESTGVSGRTEAEAILIRRLFELETEASRVKDGVFLFEEAGYRYLEEIAHKTFAKKAAYHLDLLFPFIGDKPLEQVHDGTLKPFTDHELARGLSAKSINNSLVVVSAILNRAARNWRTVDGSPWLKYAPPRISRLTLKGAQAKPYPLSWREQDRLFQLLPKHLAEACLFAVNTGLREQEVCRLNWQWEVFVADLGASVFVLPEWVTKTKTERVVVLNSVAQKVVEARRGLHAENVFTYLGNSLTKLHNSAWKRCWKLAELPTEKGILKGVHNLRHTFGRRLRSAGIALETRKALLGHANGDITTHYSAAELTELIHAVEKIVNRNIAQTPTLTVLKRNQSINVGKVSENKKGSAVLHSLTL